VTLYDHVAVVAPGLSLDRRAALSATARSLGASTSVDDELTAARERLAGLDEPVPSPADARRAVAETETDLEAQRERVAELRGRLQATDAGSAEADYRDAVRTLSELETEHIAARERLEAVRRRARDARDVRERRLELQDRIDNLARTAREELADAVRPDVDAAVRAVPDSDADSYDAAAPVTAALALVRVGVVRPPIVLACRRFPDGPTAEGFLAAPGICL